MYEQPARRGRGGLIVLTVVLLAILGAGVGLIVANVAGSQKTPDSSQGQNGGNGQNGEPSAETSGPAGKPCPGFITAKIGSAAVLKGYVVTEESEAWVCAGADGKLYYQGHRGKPGGEIIDGKNGIFLTGAVPDGAGYSVKNEDTTYVVTAQQLVIVYPNRTDTEKAEDSEGFESTNN